MADIIPFRGVLCNPKITADLTKLVAPPYDVISPDMQKELYGSYQYNVIRLILGKMELRDTKSNNRYTRARGYLNDWLKKGILEKDAERGFYIYGQKYLHKGKSKTRTGFIGLMRIEDPRRSGVLPHEYTFAGPKKDRLNLINETKANLSPIFSLFEDEDFYVTNILEKTADKRPPLFDIEIDGVNHRLWKLTRKNAIKKIRDFMKPRAIFIADGHHRYEVALAFRNQMRKKKKFRPAFNYTMVYFSSLNQEAITILSTHRVIKDISGLTKKALFSRLKEFFEIKEFRGKKGLFTELEKPGCIRFGLYCGKNIFYLLGLRDEKVLDKLVRAGKSLYWRRLAVTVLHELILNRILEIKEKIAREENIIYTRDKEYAITLVDGGRYKAAFFLSPTRVDQLRDVARSRDKMPHKSTYFYPKLLSGLVINKF